MINSSSRGNYPLVLTYFTQKSKMISMKLTLKLLKIIYKKIQSFLGQIYLPCVSLNTFSLTIHLP